MTNDIYSDSPPRGNVRKLRRSRTDRMVAGVCGGVAAVLGVEAALVRILLVAATLLGFGTGALIYLACWILMPEAD
ncbi:PspC domain-containing protein [Actinokineospora sp.]|uniref:PspC domain-containing protein n=1 Tax=Actinokineospora sp. TaxID=1872133 RepID=UPI0040383FE4